MSQFPTRAVALGAIVTALRTQYANLRKSADSARDEATHPDSKAESKYDTRAIEAGYLAGAQARRLMELETTVARYDRLPLESPETETIKGPALVVLAAADGTERCYFLGPGAGGLTVSVDGVSVTVITPSSPLGKVLLGAELGDEVLPQKGADPLVLVRLDDAVD